jgi:hypothetical protein
VLFETLRFDRSSVKIDNRFKRETPGAAARTLLGIELDDEDANAPPCTEETEP